jgi:hypothetical protein
MINSKTFFAFRTVFLCTIIIVTVIVACQKKSVTTATEEGSSQLVHPVFNKNVGGPIDSATAKKWKRNLAAKSSKSRGILAMAPVYYLQASVLQQLINVENAVGVCFYYGQNEQGQVYLVPVGVDNRGYVVPVSTVTTTNGAVSWQVAKEWRQRFKKNNPSGTWGHFWGSIAVERLLAQGTETVRINLGLNDVDAQMIMFSNAEEEDPESYEDRTRDCPPYCPRETDETDKEGN